MQQTPGKVWLVGAGPGDPELLTLKAARVIALADVILVDDLVNQAVLQHAQAGVRIVAVGKRGGCISTPQEFIERMMISEAQQGHCVVRLKGGDPGIFGRGGEELAHLRAAGIEVEVVNGISSGLAAASSLGVPLTMRGVSQGVVFVTGHGKDDEAQVDWAALAKLASTGITLVVYMGITHCAEIVRSLLAGGLSEATPVAVVQSATCVNQAQLLSSLAKLPQDLARSGLASPAVILIGEVIACTQSHMSSRDLPIVEHLNVVAGADRVQATHPICAVQ